jgi:hypothetical protein
MDQTPRPTLQRTTMVAATAAALLLAASAPPLNAQDEPARRTLAVAKVVAGTPPPGAVFTVTVECVPVGPTAAGAVGTTMAGAWELGFTANGLPDTTRPPVIDDSAVSDEAWQVADDTWELSVPLLFETYCTATETVTAGATSVAWGCAYAPAPLAAGGPDPDTCPPGDDANSITARLPDAPLVEDCASPPYPPGCVDATTLTVTNTFAGPGGTPAPEPEPEPGPPNSTPGGRSATPPPAVALAVPRFTA